MAEIEPKVALSPKKQHHHSGRSGSPKKSKDSIEALLSKPPVIVQSALSQLRYLVLVDGLKVTSQDGQCTYRPLVWSVLLRVAPGHSSRYIQHINRGPSSAYDKIRNDTFRTLTSDKQFHSKVSEEALVRVLNSYAWESEFTDASNRMRSASSVSSSSTSSAGANHDKYVQGMNVIAAPFLYISRSESQAFAMFDTFLTRDCPLYIKPTLVGVHTGLSLVDICLQIIDPAVSEYLSNKLLSAKIYAFASVLTFSACTPTLSELLALWDFMFAYGCHMNILFVVAQLTLMRDQLLEAQSPISMLRSFPPLKASEIIKLAVSFVTRLPDDVYDLLTRHPYDPTVAIHVNKLVEKNSGSRR